MRFESAKEREELISAFKEKAEELTNKKKSEIQSNPSLKNYNPIVKFDTRTEYDEIVTVTEKVKYRSNGKPYIECTALLIDTDGKQLPCSGDIYVFYIKQPSLEQSIRIFAAAKPPLGSDLNSANVAWDFMIDEKESSPEIKNDRIKLGYLFDLLSEIDALLSDKKKG